MLESYKFWEKMFLKPKKVVESQPPIQKSSILAPRSGQIIGLEIEKREAEGVVEMDVSGVGFFGRSCLVVFSVVGWLKIKKT